MCEPTEYLYCVYHVSEKSNNWNLWWNWKRA